MSPLYRSDGTTPIDLDKVPQRTSATAPLPVSELGTGTPDGTKYLRDDGVFVTPPGGSQAFPVGSVFIAVVATNPATLLGYGTWSAFGAGRVLVGLDAAQTEFDVVRETGGAKTHTLTAGEMPVHTHVQNPHTHDFLPRSATTGGVSSIVTGTLDTSSTISGANQPHVQAATPTNQNAGSGAAHNNLPPYIVVYMWERTA
jgi:hypothetical protein